jgi:hypothetical protein
MENKKFKVEIGTFIIEGQPENSKKFNTTIELDPCYSHRITIETPEGKMYGTDLQKVVELLENWIGGTGIRVEFELF